MRASMLQVDYAAAGIFINITTDSDEGHSAPWWQLEGARMAPGLEPLTPVCPCPMVTHDVSSLSLRALSMGAMVLEIYQTGVSM